MYLLPSPYKLADKVVYERPVPIGGSNTRKSKLHARARTLLTESLKEKLCDKGLQYKWVPRPVGGQAGGQRGKAGGAKGGKGGKKGAREKIMCRSS
eukprot:2260276-Pyramimonas_sp.AAC.1